MEEVDRISQLPDAILQHILTSIDINQAVQTSILSKRWRHLWSSMSELEFNFYRLARRSKVNLQCRRARQQFTHRFTHFVIQFLSHRDHSSAVTKFHLSLRGRIVREEEPRFVERCVDYAVTHGVQNLDIHELRIHPSRFPDAFFACETLRELRLRLFGNGFYMPRQFSLPNVTTLFVEKSGFVYDDNIFYGAKDPFSRFPNLEKLSLYRCSVLGLIIVAPKLRILEITFHENFAFSEAKMERISTPRLTTFKYEGYIPLECSKVELPILEELYIQLSRKFGPSTRVHDKRMPSKCVRMLQEFGNAKLVTLALDTVEVLALAPQLLVQSQSPFPYMKCLKLTKGHYLNHHPTKTVTRAVMSYLTQRCLCNDSLVVEFPEGVSVVEMNTSGYDLFDEDSTDEPQLEWLLAG